MEMTPAEEFRIKHLRVSEWLQRVGAPGVLLLSRANLSWLSLGGEVLYPTSRSSAFVVTPDSCTLLCPEDDAHRIKQEEIRGLAIDIHPVFHLGGQHLAEVARTTWSPDLVCDIPGFGLAFHEEVHSFRRQLLPPEVLQMRRLAHDLTLAVENVASECYRGILETEVAARLGAECMRARIMPLVILAAADSRTQYPHPLPKARAAEKRLVMSVRGRRRGLNASLTRTVCLTGPEVQEVEEFTRALTQQATLLHATRSGAVLGEVIQSVFDASERRWGLGGLTGYRFPEIEACYETQDRLEAGEIITWTVAGQGCRSQDTHIIHDTRTELITASEGWPNRSIKVGSLTYELPDMLLLA
jgi:Xaa-Pro aminopeptidase